MLLTYNEYNKDLGYVQGMSDLLAPIYAVMQDDAIAFWGFVGFMARMVSLHECWKAVANFDRSETFCETSLVCASSS